MLPFRRREKMSHQGRKMSDQKNRKNEEDNEITEIREH